MNKILYLKDRLLSRISLTDHIHISLINKGQINESKTQVPLKKIVICDPNKNKNEC